jgi:hypothetical protein
MIKHEVDGKEKAASQTRQQLSPAVPSHFTTE